MSDGAGTALLIIGLGVGGYALYRFMKKDGKEGSRRHLAGAPPACGPSEYWDEAHQACVPLSLPGTSTGPVPQCPPGQFFDYLRGACVSSAPVPPRTGWGHYAGDLPPLGLPPTSPTVDCPPGMQWDAAHGYCMPTEIQPLPPPVHHAGWGY